MKIDERIMHRLNELQEFGEQLLATRTKVTGSTFVKDDRVDSQLGSQWVTSVQNLFVRVFGIESEHYKNFTKQFEKHLTYSPVFRAQGVLKAAIDDFKNDQLFDVKQAIEADLFDDFLEQAEHLFDLGYYQPAAVIAGSVLEDKLRKLCLENEIEINEKAKLDFMNSEIAKAGIYDKLMQKKITFLADIRNKAAHGKWDQFTSDDVEDMIKSIRRFMEKWSFY